MPGAERLHRRFLGGKARGETGNGIALTGTIGNLGGGEHALKEAIAVAREDVPDPRNVGRVEAEADDAHDRSQA